MNNIKVKQQVGCLVNIKPENVTRKKFLGGLLKSYQKAT